MYAKVNDNISKFLHANGIVPQGVGLLHTEAFTFEENLHIERSIEDPNVSILSIDGKIIGKITKREPEDN